MWRGHLCLPRRHLWRRLSARLLPGMWRTIYRAGPRFISAFWINYFPSQDTTYLLPDGRGSETAIRNVSYLPSRDRQGAGHKNHFAMESNYAFSETALRKSGP